MNKQYKSAISENIHNLASDLHSIGLLDKKQMQQFDKTCLTQIEPLDGETIRAIREREALTQAAFAIHLNVSKNHVSAWERGIKKPSGTALKLLTLVKNKGIDAIA
ncbi:DNA-binding transcriptional regulator [Kingella kingae]|uniref:helix-turn-helix domain-containing protein n=1 Tax=Kingella kingae TaxID=504 RepID=UPI002550DEF0|nr:DNA-binding transcriptional regulator [Kingella kingae]MDK4629174.1 DNA-binding transcriptional regulator [Kingella kingae]MDK4695841.1 DNA-binding transcriptional regulator [Kingella kingae]